MAVNGYVYIIVNNIPRKYRAADLRNFFSQFIETSGFSLFHFRHRPEIQQSTASGESSCDSVSQVSKRRCVTTCCVVRVYEKRVNEFLEMYNKKHWVDREGQTLTTRCFIRKINVIDDAPSTSIRGPRILRLGQKPFSAPAEKGQFTKSDVASMIEMHPPVFMPQGNVGTPTSYFLEQIRECRLPPSIITRLALEFPKSRGKRLYGSVAFDYGGVRAKRRPKSDDADFVRTSKGEVISKTYLNPVQQKGKDGFPHESDSEEEEEEEEEEDDDDDEGSAEEWERHEALHDDVTQQERLKERLFEEPIELQWEKGGSGLVFYTDAQFWDSKDGDFDEKTADDWDIDTSGYFERGAGDTDARHLLQMRIEKRLRSGMPVYSDDDDGSNTFGAFEKHTKGFGRKMLEAHGWKQGEGIGKTVIGISEPIVDAGQHPRDKKGLGYRGERLSHFASRSRKRNRCHSEEDRILISTIYDNPVITDPSERLLRSSPLTKLKYRAEFLDKKS